MRNLRTIQADSMSEALARVKREMGDDAVILHTRSCTRGSVLGFGGRRYVEITAARSERDLPPALLRHGMAGGPARSEKRMVEALAASALKGGRAPGGLQADVAAPAGRATDTRLLTEVQDLKTLVQGLVSQTRRERFPAVPEKLLDTYLGLLENEVAEEIATELVQKLRSDLADSQLSDPRMVQARLARCVESMVPEAGEVKLRRTDGPMIVALVGPTGVGKTTTVAKLAADFSLRKQCRVGLVTIDTYRIAAVDQLKTYAQIIGVPLTVVMTPAEMRDALRQMHDRDVVLIDTAGRSQNDEVKIQELKCYLSEARAHEVHLVLSLSAGPKVLERTLERFRCVGANRVIFTKLDEAVGFGVMLSCLKKAQAKLSYLTNGQDVPADIEPGASTRVAELICRRLRKTEAPARS